MTRSASSGSGIRDFLSPVGPVKRQQVPFRQVLWTPAGESSISQLSCLCQIFNRSTVAQRWPLPLTHISQYMQIQPEISFLCEEPSVCPAKSDANIEWDWNNTDCVRLVQSITPCSRGMGHPMSCNHHRSYYLDVARFHELVDAIVPIAGDRRTVGNSDGSISRTDDDQKKPVH